MKQHTRMRHFFALAFALVMAVFLLPMAAFATSSNYVAQVTSSDPDMGGGGVVYYTTLQGALEACAEADYFMGGLDTVTLLQDVVITQTLTVADKEYGVITLDLNGYGIDADGGNFSVITVSENAYFVLKDSSGSTRTTTFDDPTSDDESDVITVTGGYITGSALTSEVDNTSVYGGGVYLAEGAFFSMESGTIVGNTVRNSDTMGSSAYGGGVYVGEGASLRMSGGTITGNHASGSTATSYADAIAYGGGVYLDTGATLSIYGSAAITNNLARYGGGVSVGSGATLDMAGDAQISNNKAFATGSSIAAVGGGVVATADAIVKISSGSISGNQVVSAGYAYGGGIYATRASVTLSGTATISGNNATSTNTGTGTYVSGGGVYVVSTAMEMYDNAVISANSLTLPSGYGSGGGVHQEDSTSYPSTFALYGNASIRGNTAIGVGGGVSIEVTNDSSYFNMSGEASITGNTASEKSYVNGGGVYLASGTFHMSGGEISGNETISTATYGSEIIYGGGGVAVYSNGTFTMSGGTISGNTATNATSYYSLNANGGGVLVIWDGTFTISGGSITGNEAKQAGGGVYLARGTVTLAAADGNDAAPIEITGNTTTTGTVSNFYLADGYTIVVGSTPTSGSSIGVTLAAPSAGAAVTTAGAAAAGVFAYDDDTYMVVGSTSTDGTAYTLISGDTVASVTDKDGAVTYYTSLEGADGAIAAANDAASKIEIPTSDSTDEFVLLTLLKSVTTNDTLTFTSMYITLDLNGYTIAAKEGNTFPVITIRGDADLYVTLTDSVGTGTITGGNAAYGGGVYVVNGNFIMNGGSISGNQATMGGGVYVNNSASFTMAGGSISDNSATLYGGGGVYLDNNASFSMSGGSITGNAASTSGGGVYVAATVSADATAHGSFTISGGSITGNTASTSGGGVYLCYPDSMCLGAAEGGNTDITITGNTLADKTTANNVYLEKETTYLGKVVTTTLALQSALTSTSRIGVTHGDVVGTLATGVSAANRLSDTAVLVPDDSSYSVLETSSSGSYTYLLGIATASVTIDGTTTEYSTLEGENGALAAANAAGTSATITLLADATPAQPLP